MDHQAAAERSRRTGPPRLLLINPRTPESFWSFRWVIEHLREGKRALNPPLGLATLAALCPDDWHVEIVDENVEAIPDRPDVDIVGVCGMTVQSHRQDELLARYRAAGYHTVAGGSYTSLRPERFAPLADTVVAGEAEKIWPAFCRDWESGRPDALYRETGEIDVTTSPPPRFDLLRLDRYVTASLQFSRGCPFRCEFCDIIVMFGRKPRTKTPEQIGAELDRLRAGGARSVFFVDDNLIGNKAKAKELLRFLIEYQERHGYHFRFGTEASINLAHDDELLELLQRANFSWIFIGIESPDEASLRETNKTQNTRCDLVEAVRRIYAYGIGVFGGFIIGFDNDTEETFAVQERFIQETGIQVAMIGLLEALPKTALFRRLEREGRLRDASDRGNNTLAATNIEPAGMSYETMVEGYKRLYRTLTDDRHIAERIRNKFRYLRPAPGQGDLDRTGRARALFALLTRGVLPGGPSRWWAFAHTLVAVTPRMWPGVLADWATGISMRAFARRCFGDRPVPTGHEQDWVADSRASREIAS